MDPSSHRGWHHRGYLPHCDFPSLGHAVTYRMADSLPAKVLARLDRLHPADSEDPRVLSARRRCVDRYLDRGHGSCVLRRDACARIVMESWRHFDDQRYRLMALVVMPNHVHLMLKLLGDWSLERVLHSQKSFTGLAINRVTRRTGPFWQKECFDRYIRDQAHFARSLKYVMENPVKAGLVERCEDWPWLYVRAGLVEALRAG